VALFKSFGLITVGLLFLPSWLFGWQPHILYLPFSSDPNAEVLWVAPSLREKIYSADQVSSQWGVQRTNPSESKSSSIKLLPVPSQTGRATRVTQTFGLPGDILLKGTGANSERMDEVALLRYFTNTGVVQKRDGAFTLREAFSDQWTSNVLESFGIRVAKPIAILSLNRKHAEKSIMIGVYARQFVSETRISNLETMSKEDALYELHRAVDRLFEMGFTEHRMDLVEHYFYLLKTMAKNVAILEHIGFEHGNFHWQQMSLAGELADLGTGRWVHSEEESLWKKNSIIPYFNFESQTLLGLNMFIRTHGFRNAPPGRLKTDSQTLQNQYYALLGILRKIAPETARKIEELDPEAQYLATYTEWKTKLKQNPLRKVSTAEGFSESASEFAHKYSTTQALDIDSFEKRFETLKDDFGMNALPDVLMHKEALGFMKNSYSATRCPDAIRRAIASTHAMVGR